MSDDLKPGEQRRWKHSENVIEIVGKVTEGELAGEYEYRAASAHASDGILPATNLLEWTEPTAPTDPSDGAVTSTPAPSDDTTQAPSSQAGLASYRDRRQTVPALVEMDRQESADRALAALVEWRRSGDVQAHILATVALRKAADEYIAAVTS